MIKTVHIGLAVILAIAVPMHAASMNRDGASSEKVVSADIQNSPGR